VDMGPVIDELEKNYPSVIVCRIEAEKELELSNRFGVDAVPLCVLVRGGETRARVEGLDPLDLDENMQAVFGDLEPGSTRAPGVPKQSLDERLHALVSQSRVMLFMKGTPDEPRCGFSAKVVQALHAVGCSDYGSFDILSDEDVRQGLKKKFNWPTFPQLYCEGELVGGCDIILEMEQDGSLRNELGVV
jgi:Grx4 family monothiol glutaredoxin